MQVRRERRVVTATLELSGLLSLSDESKIERSNSSILCSRACSACLVRMIVVSYLLNTTFSILSSVHIFLSVILSLSVLPVASLGHVALAVEYRQ